MRKKQSVNMSQGLVRVLSVLGLWVAGVQEGIAQQEPSGAQASENLVIEEVIVTASKRSERLQDTPVAITALDAARIEKQGITSFADYATQVPNLALANGTTPGTGVVIIRGLYSGNVQLTQTSATYIGETPFTASGSVSLTSHPTQSIKPLGSCVDVERVVSGIRASEHNHWISAFGIIDRDNRTDEECERLQEDGIIPLEQYSVESLYYHPFVIHALLSRVATVNEIDIDATMTEIVDSVAQSVNEHKERMAARMIERKVKEHAYRECPDWRKILEDNVEIKFSSAPILNEELTLISGLIEEKDVEKLISRYPLRETPALDLIARKTLFPSREKYEQAVRKMLIDSNEILQMMKNIIQPATRLLS